jgi:hypothetical protein
MPVKGSESLSNQHDGVVREGREKVVVGAGVGVGV